MQARLRYARPCGLDTHVGPQLRLLDIGTGLGLNLAAALEAVHGRGVRLEIDSFEADPCVIAHALALYELPDMARGPWEPWHAPLRGALREGCASPGSRVPILGPDGVPHTLTLHLMDARRALERVPREHTFDAVFLDPFSPRRGPELWEERFLGALAARLAPEGWLSTYSAAFRMRLALVRAGLRVGRGPRVGAKGEGTLASPCGTPPPLDGRVARRLARRCVPAAAPGGHFGVSMARDGALGRLESEAWRPTHRPPGVDSDPNPWAPPLATDP
jgi:tRNA U34 5-methylaminomethyl-2-thiouridine-forming methyltransferase MnmC